MRLLLSLAVLMVAAPFAAAQDLVAKTDAKTPAEELKCFKLPPGFEAQLVASEPDIQKPMQMAFDNRNRLWVTTSYHYPYAAAEGKGTDKLFVLSDFGDDGKAKKIQVFDDKLNIPIGVLPLADGKSVIVSECGKILKLTDTDGDMKADKREVLFSGFGFKDTHGMYNSYTQMPDGWVYACHGFANDSTVKGTDGHEVKMHSGHTFRFKTDGSRIEIFTRGQVNPFGMCVDPWLNLYTADCHSKPMTQLVRGAYYDSFGKPHDGLGYAPHVINHLHDSTGLCGITYYAADHFPKEWADVMFVGNVVTSRINCDKIQWKGATPVGKEMPDFLSSSDPWFRPVDIKLGPDGALYVNDFYNKVIGHYEVPLTHPGRDKDRGRVWRIVYKGKDGKGPAPKFHRADWAKATDNELFADFGHPNTTVRLMAANEAASRAKINPEGGEVLTEPANASARMGLYAMVSERTGIIKLDDYVTFADYGKNNADKIKPETLTGLLVRALVSRDKWGAGERKLALDWFATFDNIRVKRAVVDGMTAHPDAEFIAPLLKFIPTIAADDTTFKHAAKVALRNCLEAKGGWDEAMRDVSKGVAPVLIEVGLALKDKPTVPALLGLIKAGGDSALPYRFAVAELVGKNSRRLGEWEALLELQWMTKIDVEKKTATQLEIAVALLKGVQASGAKDLSWTTKNPVEPLVKDGLRDMVLTTNRLAIRALRLWMNVTSTDKLVDAEHHIPLLLAWVTKKDDSVEHRYDAVEILNILAPKKVQPILREVMTDLSRPVAERERMAAFFLTKSSEFADFKFARDAIKTAPYAVAVSLAVGLATDTFGADLLLAAVKAGEAPVRLLQEKAVLDRLKATKVADLDKKVADLTKGILPPDKRIEDLIKKRADGFRKGQFDVAKGQEVFKKSCAICHQIGNEGAKVGPQLDGIGIRGLERLLEDTLDPNRNVDAAFKSTTLVLSDGRSPTGLVREDGNTYVLVDGMGKENRIPKADVDKVVPSNLSAMPANVDATVSETDYYHLIAYLLQQRPR